MTDKKAKVVQHFAYMPFGELLVDNSTVDLDYRFSAKETDRESGLGYFGARYYDNISAMWLGVDPLWEKYAGMNPYNYCAGNPVMLVDEDGRKFTKAAESEVQILEQEIDNKISDIEKADKPKRWHESKLNKLKDVQKEINELRESKQVYDLRTYRKEVNSNESDYRGFVSYDQENDQFVINVNTWRDATTEGSELGAFAHELKHAYQFETGRFSFSFDKRNNVTEIPGILYDLTDEEEAFERGSLFGAGALSPNYTVYKSVPRTDKHLDNKSILQIEAWNKKFPLSKKFRNEIFRNPK